MFVAVSCLFSPTDSSAARAGIARAGHSKRPTRNTRSIAVAAASMSARLPVSAAESSNRIA